MSNHLVNSYDYLLKFLVVGNAGVGKSCMLHQFLHKKFSSDTQHTIGAELGSKILTVDPAKNEKHERKIKLQIWDTAGQERFRAVTRSYYRGACGCLLVYDVTDRESFASVSNWLKDAKSLASENITIILCGNKSDLVDDRQVTTAEATSFAEENNGPFFSKTVLLILLINNFSNTMIDDIFRNLCKNIKKCRPSIRDVHQCCHCKSRQWSY